MMARTEHQDYEDSMVAWDHNRRGYKREVTSASHFNRTEQISPGDDKVTSLTQS